MKEPVLIVMAAGMGSRYGGLKQMDPVDEQGHAILDFSVYDAKRAGFKKVVFIIKHAIEKDFREIVGKRIEPFMEVEYVFQELRRDRCIYNGTGFEILLQIGLALKDDQCADLLPGHTATC